MVPNMIPVKFDTKESAEHLVREQASKQVSFESKKVRPAYGFGDKITTNNIAHTSKHKLNYLDAIVHSDIRKE